jgi:chromosome segregation protein
MTHVGLSTAVTGTPPQSGEELALKAADANVQRIKAEGKAKGMEEQIAKLEADNLKQEKDIHALKTKCEEQKLTIDKLEKQKEQADRDLVEAKADIETWKRKRDEISGSRDDYKILSEKLKAEKEVLEPKYHDALAKNLELTKKLTQANEDYMKVAKELDDTKEALGRAKNEAKKIIRVVP